MEPEGLLPHSQSPPPVLNPRQHNLVHALWVPLLEDTFHYYDTIFS